MTGGDLLGHFLVNGLLTAATCGLAAVTGYVRWNTERWYAEKIVIDGKRLVYTGSWSDSLGNAIVCSCLAVFTCGLAAPVATVIGHRFHASKTQLEDGRRLEFRGTIGDAYATMLVDDLISLPFLLFLLPGIVFARLVTAPRRRRYYIENLWLLPPEGAPAEIQAERLAFDGTVLSNLIPTVTITAISPLTLWLYLPFGLAKYERWAWSITRFARQPKKRVRMGPRSPAEWATVVGYSLSIVAPIALVFVLFGGGAIAALLVRLRGGGPTPSPAGHAPTVQPAARPVRPEPRSAPGVVHIGPPLPTIPEARSAVPKLKEWGAAPQVNSAGPDEQPDGCFVKVVREWAKLQCSGATISDLQGLGSHGHDYFTFVTDQVGDVLVRIRRGTSGGLVFQRATGDVRVRIEWPADQAQPTFVGMSRVGAGQAAPPARAEECSSAPDGSCATTLYVQLATVPPGTPPDHPFRPSRAVLEAQGDLSGVELVEGVWSGSRILAAIVRNQCQAEKVKQVTDDAFHSHPAVRCGELEVGRRIWTHP